MNDDTLSIVSKRRGAGRNRAGDEREKEVLAERDKVLAESDLEGAWLDGEVGLPAAPRAPRGGAGIA